MPVTVTYPGVYIEELGGLSLSISSGATAVPAFAVKDDNPSNPPSGKTTRIDSWFDFTDLIKTSSNAADQAFNPANVLHLSVKTYFDNGGGRCYIGPLKALERDVSALDDITLVVQACTYVPTFSVVVDRLCVAPRTLFALYDGPNGALGDKPDDDLKPYGPSIYAAVYYPWLKAQWATTKASDGSTLYHPIPPSAAVAGAYCTVDRERGVWKAPANVPLKGGLVPAY